MKLKLDENIGRRGVELLEEAGHDVRTVLDQNLQGTRDETLFEVCAKEGRTLVTLDRDFGEILRFPPEATAGVIILDARPQATPSALLARLRDFLAVAKARSPRGALWIIERGRVRIHSGDD